MIKKKLERRNRTELSRDQLISCINVLMNLIAFNVYVPQKVFYIEGLHIHSLDE